ncbi:MAG TPA: efflux RND transporter periplasmic adaptor subunit [Candidatus Tectomicrobia bacterium]
MQGRALLFCSILISLTQPLWQVSSAYGETFDCLLKPYVVVHVSSGVEGILETVTVDRGDLVKQGQVLATLESSAEQAMVARAQAQATMQATIKSNQARLELSTSQLSRHKGLHQKALIADDKMEEVEASKRLAELNLREALERRRLAELELRHASAELARRTIKSPITGVVVERVRHPGEFANENPILTLAQMHPLHVEVFVPVHFLGQVAVGMRAEVMPEPPVNRMYEARVKTIDRLVDAASGMFGVRLELPNHDYRIPAGLKCQVSFQPSGTRQEQVPGLLSRK